MGKERQATFTAVAAKDDENGGYVAAVFRGAGKSHDAMLTYVAAGTVREAVELAISEAIDDMVESTVRARAKEATR